MMKLYYILFLKIEQAVRPKQREEKKLREKQEINMFEFLFRNAQLMIAC